MIFDACHRINLKFIPSLLKTYPSFKAPYKVFSILQTNLYNKSTNKLLENMIVGMKNFLIAYLGLKN